MNKNNTSKNESKTWAEMTPAERETKTGGELAIVIAGGVMMCAITFVVVAFFAH